MTMIRKQFFIDREKSLELRRVAAARGLSEAELIRLGIDRILVDQGKESAAWKAKFSTVMASLGDNSELADRIEKIKKFDAGRLDKRLARNRKLLDRR